MLDKPKFLTGVVKEFIDTTFICVKSSGYGEAFDIDRWFNINEYKLKPFYNQPFDPKMIEKYFKGWDTIFLTIEITGNKVSQYTNIEIGKDIFIKHKFNLISIENWEIPIPNTLSQFITFVLSAGITLEWRE